MVDDGHLTSDYINRIFKRVAERAGLLDISFHILRHSRAIGLLRKGVDIAYVQKLLGHRRLDTTSIYTVSHITPEDVRTAIEGTEKMIEGKNERGREGNRPR